MRRIEGWGLNHSMELTSIFSTIGIMAMGALLAYMADFGRFRRAEKSKENSLRVAIAAEIYANNEITIENILGVWPALDEGAEHIPALSFEIHDSIYNLMKENIGLIKPEEAAQIIFFYIRLNELVDQHKLLQKYLIDMEPGEWPPRGGYGTHRMSLSSLGHELSEDASELIRILNGGKQLGNIGATFDLRPNRRSKKQEVDPI